MPGEGQPADDPKVPQPGRLDPGRPDHEAILRAHQRAVYAGKAGYLDPSTGLFVLTSAYLRERGYCCGNGCRHCPYGADAERDIPQPG